MQRNLHCYRYIVLTMYGAETCALKKAPVKGAPSNLGSPSYTYLVFNISKARRVLSVCFATTTLDRIVHILC